MPDNHELLKWHCRPEVERPLRYARRVVKMGPAEITARLRERAHLNRKIILPPWTPPNRTALGDWLERRFLFGPQSAGRIVEAWHRRRPRQALQLVDLARRGLERWEIFGVAVELEPSRIDWSSPPEAGRYDRRWVWELSRHQHLFTFARAFALTGETRYAERIAALLEDWWTKNPLGHGVNWSSSLEVGVRAISWLWTLPLILDWPGLENSLLRQWLLSLYEHYIYLGDHLSLHTDPSNHLIGEVAALWLLSAALPNLSVGQREEQRKLYLLGREIQRQVSADGVDLEQSTGYQRFVLDFYLQVLALARRTNRPVPAVIEQRTEAMLDFLAALAGDEGEPPAIGDSDDGRGVPFPELAGWDFRDVLSSGAALLARPAPGPLTPEVAVWLAGPEALNEAPPSGLPFPPSSRVFPQGGYCLWEAQVEGRRAALLFDVGPLGLWPNASHGHADALSVQVNLGGRWILGDPGTGAYSAQGRVRDLLRGTAAHNTVAVDAMDQSDALEVFKWLKPVPVRLLDHCTGHDYDYAVAVHEGYRRLRDPVTHYRAVLFVRPPAPRPGWIVLDWLEGEGRHECRLLFHFPPGVQLHSIGSQAVLALDPSTGMGLDLLFSDAHAASGPVYEIHPDGLWSRRFGHWEPAPVLSVARKADLPLAWCTFLTPTAAPVFEQAEISIHENGALCHRRSPRGEETVEWTIGEKRPRLRYQRAGVGFER